MLNLLWKLRKFKIAFWNWNWNADCFTLKFCIFTFSIQFSPYPFTPRTRTTCETERWEASVNAVEIYLAFAIDSSNCGNGKTYSRNNNNNENVLSSESLRVFASRVLAEIMSCEENCKTDNTEIPTHTHRMRKVIHEETLHKFHSIYELRSSQSQHQKPKTAVETCWRLQMLQFATTEKHIT